MYSEASKQSLLDAELSVPDYKVIFMATGKQSKTAVEALRAQVKTWYPTTLNQNSIAHLHKHAQSFRT